MRSCGLPTRSVGPTNRSVSLLVGRTYLSGTAVSLVGGDLGVPMSHINYATSENRRDVMVCWHRVSILDCHLGGTLYIIVILQAW
jgi:hypothetical protein